MNMESIDHATLDDISALADLLTLLFAQEADFVPDESAQREGLRLIISTPVLPTQQPCLIF